MSVGIWNFGESSLMWLLPLAGVLLGAFFGAFAQWSRFCFRSAVIQIQERSKSPMAGGYLIALLTAGVGAQLLASFGFITFEGTRFAQSELAIGPLLAGGLLFGAGMVLTRGCPSRLTVLAAQGNLRAVLTLVIFAIVAFASLRGVLAPLRRFLAEATTIQDSTFGGVIPLWGAATICALALFFIWKSRVTTRLAVAGFGIGIVIVLGWFVTGAMFHDPFDPQPAQSLAFTSGASDALFFAMASSAIDPGFPAGVFVGVIFGAWFTAFWRRELRIESFENGSQTLRYIAGATAMGIGGVWAGGCTIGAGLSGTSALSVSAFLALFFMAIGAALTNLALKRGAVTKYGIKKVALPG